MATVTHVSTIDYSVTKLGEDPEFLEAIFYNEDNLNNGAIISVCTSSKHAVTSFTDRGIEKLRDRLTAARITPKLGMSSSATSSMTPISSPASMPNRCGSNRQLRCGDWRL